jgi:hypothetical protein
MGANMIICLKSLLSLFRTKEGGQKVKDLRGNTTLDGCSFQGNAYGATGFGNHCKKKYVSDEQSPSVLSIIKSVRAAGSQWRKRQIL